mmetsp:Transcript_82921/g.234241  ORF Transcript_82921/g.234241 Transcript_82921/m.234241 type:complete len:143 (-) Transcript_82921:398-826(-)
MRSARALSTRPFSRTSSTPRRRSSAVSSTCRCVAIKGIVAKALALATTSLPTNTPTRFSVFHSLPRPPPASLLPPPLPALHHWTQMGRFGEAAEMAKAALFLASSESSYVTGTEFLVDGGICAAYVTPEGDVDPFGGPTSLE